MGESDYDWSDYESTTMFAGCDCGHDATDHAAAWSEYRRDDNGDPLEGCMHCGCEQEWEHT